MVAEVDPKSWTFEFSEAGLFDRLANAGLGGWMTAVSNCRVTRIITTLTNCSRCSISPSVRFPNEKNLAAACRWASSVNACPAILFSTVDFTRLSFVRSGIVDR